MASASASRTGAPSSTYDSPSRPRSSAATNPPARSSTWTRQTPTLVSARYAQPAPEGARELGAERRVVARAVDLAGHRHDDRRAGGDPLLGDEMGPVLRLVVPAQEAGPGVAPVGLVDEPPARVAEDVDRRDVDDPRRAGGDRGVEDAGRRADVGVLHGRPLARSDADPVRAGAVDQPHRNRRPVSEARPPTTGRSGRAAAEIAERPGPGRVADRGDDLVAPGPEPTNDGRADEPGRARDEDAHGDSLGPLGAAGPAHPACPASRPRSPVRPPRARP